MRAHEQNIETDILVVLLIKKKFYLHNAIITITNRSKKIIYRFGTTYTKCKICY